MEVVVVVEVTLVGEALEVLVAMVVLVVPEVMEDYSVLAAAAVMVEL